MDIDGAIVVLRGPAGLLARPDAPNTGPWAHLNKGWCGIIFDGSDIRDPRYHHMARKTDPDGNNYNFVHLSTDSNVGVDATKNSGSIPAMFYYMPHGSADTLPGPNDYESFPTYTGARNGATLALVDYTNDEGRYFSCGLAVEVVE